MHAGLEFGIGKVSPISSEKLMASDFQSNELARLKAAGLLSAVTPDPKTVAALVGHELTHSLLGNYEKLLRRKIFPHPVINLDKKAQTAAQNKLCQPYSYSVLTILWKESACVSDAERLRAGHARLFPGGDISQFGLATKVLLQIRPESYDQNDVLRLAHKTNGNVNKVAKAAAAFGLVERHRVHSKRLSISATRVLHDFMLEMHEVNMQLFKRSAPPAPDPTNE